MLRRRKKPARLGALALLAACFLFSRLAPAEEGGGGGETGGGEGGSGGNTTITENTGCYGEASEIANCEATKAELKRQREAMEASQAASKNGGTTGSADPNGGPVKGGGKGGSPASGAAAVYQYASGLRTMSSRAYKVGMFQAARGLAEVARGTVLRAAGEPEPLVLSAYRTGFEEIGRGRGSIGEGMKIRVQADTVEKRQASLGTLGGAGASAEAGKRGSGSAELTVTEKKELEVLERKSGVKIDQFVAAVESGKPEQVKALVAQAKKDDLSEAEVLAMIPTFGLDAKALADGRMPASVGEAMALTESKSATAGASNLKASSAGDKGELPAAMKPGAIVSVTEFGLDRSQFLSSVRGYDGDIADLSVFQRVRMQLTKRQVEMGRR